MRIEAVETVRAFFAALDGRDIASLKSMLLPDAVIVSDTGTATDLKEAVRMIRSGSLPRPEARETYNFEVPRRRQTAQRDRADLYYEDGSMLSLSNGSPGAEQLIPLAREVLRKSRPS